MPKVSLSDPQYVLCFDRAVLMGVANHDLLPQALKTSRNFLWILEVTYSEDARDPPLFIAHLPDFNRDLASEPVVGTGGNPEEAQGRLRQHLKVIFALM